MHPQHILLNFNNLTGSLPVEWLQMPYLNQLYIHHNSLSGTLSRQMLLPALSVRQGWWPCVVGPMGLCSH